MIAKSNIVQAFRQCGVSRGDVMMLHADAIVLAQIPGLSSQERYQLLFDALFEVLGEDGTLIMPSFTYSFTKGENFDPATTPSTVGALTEYFRQLPGVSRSRHPIFSVCARGRLAECYAGTAVDDCFGEHSPFALLVKHNAWIGCLACGFDRITFVHYVEQQEAVDYRYFKVFTGNIVNHHRNQSVSTRYFVRDTERKTETHLTQLKAHMELQAMIHTASIGRIGLLMVKATQFLQQANYLLSQNPVALIAEGAS